MSVSKVMSDFEVLNKIKNAMYSNLKEINITSEINEDFIGYLQRRNIEYDKTNNLFKWEVIPPEWNFINEKNKLLYNNPYNN